MILLMGVAGAGKSSQGRLLADQYGYAWISTGEILRVLVTGSRRQAMLRGQLLTDQEMIRVIDKVLDLIDPNDEFILDGFPRTVKQAEWLLQEGARGRFSRILIFHLSAVEATVRKRLSERGRLDDTEQAITKRFAEYKKVTLPIIELLKAKGAAVYEINAEQNPEVVHAEILHVLESLPPHVIPTRPQR